MNRVTTHLVLTAIAVVVIASPNVALSDMVPATFRLNTDFSNVNTLTLYDGVSRPAGSSVSRPWGNITGNVTDPLRLWFFDDGSQPSGWDSGTTFLTGLQPIGYYDNAAGSSVYNFQAAMFPSDYGLYGDYSITNTVDEGAWEGASLTILAQNMNTDTFYHANFTSGSLASGYTGTLGQNDIHINSTVVPLPAAVILGILGLGVAGFKLRKYC